MYKLQKLKNKSNLLVMPMEGAKSTTVLVLVPVGSRYENKKISGASHFVEHLMFKGTNKRPTALDISKELDSVGADFNAFTSKDYTGYYIRIDSSKQEMAFELLADMLFNSKFESEEIDRERGVIVEELRMYEDNPTMGIGLLFDSLLFGDCPLGWDEGGNIQTVKKMSRNDLWKYYKSTYVPENMVIAVAGNITEKKAKNLSKYFSKEKNKTKGIIRKNKYKKFVWNKKKIRLEDRIVVKEKEIDQAHVMMGFPGLPKDHKDSYVLSVLMTILGGGMSSRLFLEVRERRGLAYMVHAGASKYRDVGTVIVRAGLDPNRFREAWSVIKNELEKISNIECDETELEKAKSSIKGRVALSMEGTNEIAQWYANQFWFSRKIEKPEEMIEKMNKVTSKQVKNLAKKIFDFDQVRLAVIGPIKKQQILKNIK